MVLGTRMAGTLEALGTPLRKIRIISNWADGQQISPIAHADNPLRPAWALNGSFVVGYSGDLGRAHDYQTFLEAISDLERRTLGDDIGVLWLFIGCGALFSAFQSEVAERGLTTVVFKPCQPRERLSETCQKLT